MKKVLFVILILVIAALLYFFILKPASNSGAGTTPPIKPTVTVPEGPTLLPTSGIALYEQGKYKDAIVRLQEELSDPNLESADRCLAYLAFAYEKNKEHEASVKIWTRLFNEHPASVFCGDGYYELGRNSKSPQEKIQYLEKALKYHGQGGWAAGIELGGYYLSQKDIPDFEYKARHAYSLALQSSLTKEKTVEIKTKLNELNRKLMFSSFATPDSTIYIVQPGDNISKISNRHKVEAGSSDIALGHIRRINNKKSATIFPNEKLKIITAPMWVKVSKKNFTLTLYVNDDYVKEYLVSIGDPTKNSDTPSGSFTIGGKVVNPPWYGKTQDGKKEVIPFGDPRNILGTRWMSFKESPQLGIHGTTAPELGKKVSNGCVRMRNEEVEELYDLLSIGSKVIIEE